MGSKPNNLRKNDSLQFTSVHFILGRLRKELEHVNRLFEFAFQHSIDQILTLTAKDAILFRRGSPPFFGREGSIFLL